MCGICGYYSNNNAFSDNDLKQATQLLEHRGPDAEGYFQDEIVGLGHRRLSIIDLSEAANQPMHSHCGRYAIVYNGEIYNFKEIANKLQKEDSTIRFRTSSDTEVVLEAFVKWKTKCVHHFNGMFAFAVYDKQEKKLFLFRDRMGIKPLYYLHDGKNFAFASELKSLTNSPVINSTLKINKSLIGTFLHIGYIPEPHSIFHNIYKLPAGSLLTIDKNGCTITPYWTLREQIQSEVIGNFSSAKKQFKELLISSVKYRLISDVPYGTFLSGGTDSSLVTAVAQELTGNLKTFSIGFKESKYNEAGYARAIAKYLGTQHYEFILSYQDAIKLFDEIISTYDEPFADSSSIATMLVSKLARKHVKMTLSGDGGDELFFGYGSYKWADRLSNPFLQKMRKPIASVLSQLGNREQRAAKLFEYNDKQKIKSHIFSQEQYWFSEKEIFQMLTEEYNHPVSIEEKFYFPKTLTPSEQQAFFDLKYYLKDDLLVKVDRAGMKYSLETRVPLLDYRIVEFALNLSPKLKIKNGVSKFLLKKVLYNFVPKKYFDHPKWGFALPIRIWLKNELRYLLDEYLSEEMILKTGIIKYEAVKKLKKDFLNGKDFLYGRVWLLIVLHKFFNR